MATLTEEEKAKAEKAAKTRRLLDQWMAERVAERIRSEAIFTNVEGRLKDNIELERPDRLGAARKTPRVVEFLERETPLIDVRPDPRLRWCSRGHHWADKREFTPDRSRPGGVDRYCRACRRAYRKDLREAKRRRWNDGRHLAAQTGKKRRKR